MLSRFDPHAKHKAYARLLDSRGNEIEEIFVSPENSQNYIFTDISCFDEALFFLGYRYESSIGNDYSWIGKLSLNPAAAAPPKPPNGAVSSADVDIYIDGQKQSFVDRPVMLQGRTLLPMRVLFEALGAAVDWDGATSTAIGSRDGIEVRIPIGSKSPTVNGSSSPVDVPAQLISGRTYIPLRFVGEALGDDVEWDGATNSVIITKI